LNAILDKQDKQPEMNITFMPHGWMKREEPRLGRSKAWRCIDLTLIWGATVCLGSLWLWMMGDTPFLDFHAIHWIILLPGPVLITLAIYFRFTERTGEMEPGC